MTPAKILVIKLRSLGDTVLMTAPLLELTRAFPNSEIHVVTTQTWAPLIEGFPGIQKVWPFEKHKEKTARARTVARTAFQLRKEKFNWAINFHASPSSATLAWASGAKVRSIHFHGHRDKNRYSTVIVPGKGVLKPIIERDMDTLRALNIHVPAGKLPRLFLRPHELREAKEILDRLALPEPILGISLGASRPTKSWPIERFAALAVEWKLRTGGGTLAFAGPGEELKIKSFMQTLDDLLQSSLDTTVKRAGVRNSIQATNQLKLRQLAAISSQLDVLAGNDSGPRHMAVATDTPTVTLFGPENPFEWHPYPQDRHPYLFVEDLTCRKDQAPGMPAWCGLDTCKVEDHRCMKMLGVESVIALCEKVRKGRSG